MDGEMHFWIYWFYAGFWTSVSVDGSRRFVVNTLTRVFNTDHLFRKDGCPKPASTGWVYATLRHCTFDQGLLRPEDRRRR